METTRPCICAPWAVVLLLAATARPQTVDGPPGLLATIISQLRQIETCARTLAVVVEVEVYELDGEPLQPPGRSVVKWSHRGGRALVQVTGLDLDGIRTAVAAPDPGRARLYLPGGLTESLDLGSGSFTRDQRSYLDATSLASDLGPGELWWSFCGSPRSAILLNRAAVIAQTGGTAPARLVLVSADDRAGTQRITFECAEEWGFLPRTCSMLVREDLDWVEVRRVEILSARLTRLGYVPKTATLTALLPGPGPAGQAHVFKRLRAGYRLSVPEPVLVSVPRSVMAAGLEPRPEPASRAAGPVALADQDSIFGSASVLFREPIASRGDDLDTLLAPLAGLGPGSGPGRLDPAAWWATTIAAACAAVGTGACLLRRRKLLVAASLGSCAILAWLGVLRIAEAKASPDDALATRLRAGSTMAGPLPPAKTLCGVDCLYAAIARAGGQKTDYAELVKLVRPGAQGTTLDTLRIVGECLDLGPEVVNPRSYETPPDPLIGHVAPRHFVVVTGLNDGAVAIVDPARGVFRASWSDVRKMLSPVGLAFRGRGRS